MGAAGAGGGAGAFSSMGESGGGGMSVPSVREKVTGVRAGRVNRPLGLPFAGMISSFRPTVSLSLFSNGWDGQDEPKRKK